MTNARKIATSSVFVEDGQFFVAVNANNSGSLSMTKAAPIRVGVVAVAFVSELSI